MIRLPTGGTKGQNFAASQMAELHLKSRGKWNSNEAQIVQRSSSVTLQVPNWLQSELVGQGGTMKKRVHTGGTIGTNFAASHHAERPH